MDDSPTAYTSVAMQKSLYRVSVDIKVGAEYEKTITYGDVKVTAVRVLSVELVVNDVLVL